MKILIAILLLTGITASFKRAADHKAIATKISQRKTIGSLKDAEGLVRNIGSKEKPVYIIRYQKGFMNLLANNIPSEFQQDSLAVVFSGHMKEMSPMEDELGQYFVVNSIRQEH
jgi:uncharacterized protein YaaW (UPF0174 family)